MMITAASPPLAMTFACHELSHTVRSYHLECVIIMLMSRTIEIPFPTPFSVIRSPIHIRNADPAVNVSTTIVPFTKLIFQKSLRPNPTAIAILQSEQDQLSHIVVIAAIFFFHLPHLSASLQALELQLSEAG